MRFLLAGMDKFRRLAVGASYEKGCGLIEDRVSPSSTLCHLNLPAHQVFRIQHERAFFTSLEYLDVRSNLVAVVLLTAACCSTTA